MGLTGSIRPLDAVLVGAGLAGLGLRIWFLGEPAGALDSDEGVAGVMVLHLLKGEPSVFYWGQSWGGTLEIGLQAISVAIIGPTTLALKLVPIGLHALSSFLVGLAALRLSLTRREANAAAAMFWLWPPYFVHFSTKAVGFYGVAIFLTAGILALCAMGARQLTPRIASALGAAVGLGLWNSQQVLLLALPAVGWLAFNRGRSIARFIPFLVVGFLGGAAPWIYYNLRYGFPSLTIVGDATGASAGFGPRIFELVMEHLPGALGAPLDASTTLRVVVLFAFLALLVAFSRGRRASRTLVIATLIVFIALLSLPSPFPLHVRYLYSASPLLAIVIGWGFARLRSSLQAVLILVLVAVSLPQLRQVTPATIPANAGPVTDFLENHEISRVVTSYWNAYRITFLSGEEVLATSADPIRFDPNRERVLNSKRIVYVISDERDERRFEDAMSDVGIAAHVSRVGSFTIYEPVKRITPDELPGMSWEFHGAGS